MKRFAAILLTGCLVLQPLQGSVLAAQETEVSTEAETVQAVDDFADSEEKASETSKSVDAATETDAQSAGAEETESAAQEAETSQIFDAEDSGEEASAQTESETQEAPETEPVSEEGPAGEPSTGEASTEETSTEEYSSEGASPEEASPEEFLTGEQTTEAISEAVSEELPPEEELIFEDTAEEESEAQTETELDLDAYGVMLVSTDSWAGKSFLEVKVVATLPFLNPREVTVSLTDGPQPVIPRTVTVPGETSVSGSTKFSVEPGEYTVRIHAEKFADYVQRVTVVEDATAKIEVCMSKTEKTAENSGTRGWLRLGDITGDGKILSAFDPQGEQPADDQHDDVKVMLNAIRGNATYTGYNLNETQDGVADIADLQYIVQSLGREQLATVELQSVPQSLMPVENTVVTGVDNLLNDEGTMQLAPAGDNEISAEHPVAVEFSFEKKTPEGETVPSGSLPLMEGMTIQAPVQNEAGAVDAGVNNIASGTAEVTYVDETGSEQKLLIPLGDGAAAAAAIAADGVMAIAGPVEGHASVEPDGSLVLNFGGKVAVKSVTIKITGTKMAGQKLMDIAKVEFVNDMASRIPAPQMNIPTNVVCAGGNEEITVSWDRQANVTGYEVTVTGPTKKSGGANVTQTVRVSDTPHTIASINDESLVNFKDYTVTVRSVNGEWSSADSEPVTIQPGPTDLPDAVDNLVTTGGYRSVRATWKDMDDANGYMLYYREQGVGDYIPVIAGYAQPASGEGCLTGCSYTIEGLSDGTTYEVYVVGWNPIGWSKKHSLVSVVTTDSGETPQLPQYKLINTSNGAGKLSAHIVSAAAGDHGGQKMVSSPLDEAKAGTVPTVNGAQRPHAQWALGVADDDYMSYWIKNDWDDGVSYPVNDFSKGITVTFDAEYEMNYLTFTAADLTASPEVAAIRFWGGDLSGDGTQVGCRLIREIDAANRPYFVVKFDKKVSAQQIQLCLGTGYNKIDLKVAEMHFHYYDRLDDDIMSLFADEMHASLADGVTQERIDALRVRLNTPDAETGELHPLYKLLELELQAAEELLKWGVGETFAVDNRITKAKDGHINFGGLNEWQPLGRVAAAGDKLIVYVGHNTKNVGERSDLKLYFTQYHAEANSLANYYSLKVGPNEITLVGPSNNDAERGGQLYIAYEGNNPNDQYGVRINGGTKIPVLNVYKKEGAERTAAIEAYVAQLESYQSTIGEQHETLHKGSDNKNVNAYEYGDGRNCFLNATDVMMDHMLYSFPATQVWQSLSGSGTADKAAVLDGALRAMDQTMTLFYQHKGLSLTDSGKGGRNLMPSRHLNIRYMRMFSGAFMYASGNHIGVEYGQTTLCGAASWNSFGWGIAHEIGHDINDPAYAIAEITNNYFAQLLTGAYNGPRWGSDYRRVYEKVTSGTIGRSPNVGTQLALYWQLHLAYDDFTDDRTIFTDYETQFNSLFFARVDTYSRNPGLAKELLKNGADLKLDGGVDQNLMRLSVAAANANILPFFERWGMVPDEQTRDYAMSFGEPTEKALYYVNDGARNYRVANLGTDPGSYDVEVTASAEAVSNQVTISVRAGGDPDRVLGYEIERGMASKGEMNWEVIGFVQAGDDGTAEGTGDSSAVYRDTIATMDNRVMNYRVRAVDKFLNYSPTVDAGSAKISTEGVLGKELWTVETTMASAQDSDVVYDMDDPDSGYGEESGNAVKRSGIGRVIDNKWQDDPYIGSFVGSERIVIDMQKTTGVTSVRYMGDDLTLSVAVSTDGNNWTSVKDHYTVVDSGAEFATIWFDSVHEALKDKWIGTYDARYIRFTIEDVPGRSADAEGAVQVAINEIDVCGPSGDNVEFYSAGSSIPAVGIVKSDYYYDRTNPDAKIPAGSLLFAGTYKGNPAYNVVVLFDQDGNVIGADDAAGETHSNQLFFADVPEEGELGETYDGAWVYYVEPGFWENSALLAGTKSVRAELFRVDNAHTLEGERIVSDTVALAVPEGFPAALPPVELTDDLQVRQ